MKNKNIEDIEKEFNKEFDKWKERTKLDELTKATITINVVASVFFITEAIINKNFIYILIAILYLTIAIITCLNAKIIKQQDVLLQEKDKLFWEYVMESNQIIEKQTEIQQKKIEL